MTVQVTCPNPACGHSLSVEEQSLGRRGRCRKCGQVFALARSGVGHDPTASGDASAWKGSAPSRPAAGPAEMPEQFGRYRIIEELGRGGMGAVYLAHDTKLDRRVALKVPFFHPADGPRAVQRFEREARAAATLDHPNLCPIYDVGEVDGAPYLTMPYIEGKPFSEAIPPGHAVGGPQAAAVARKLALALAEAHARGIIHRDLKPGNIMVNRRRELVIMDFGLARMAGGDDDAPLTRTGNVLGTALYMAPEQAAGDVAAIGPASDIYSLGVILYELLTGHRPFEGPWSLVIGLKSVMDPDLPSRHRPGLDPALDAICLKAIARKPADRYQSMTEFAEALAGYLAAPTPAPAAGQAATAPKPASPAEKPESLAAQAFAGLISREETSLRGEKPAALPKPKFTPPRIPARAAMIAGGAASALLLGIVVIIVATNKGQIRIELDDPGAVVKVDGGEVARIEGLGEPITLRAGEHELSVKWGNGEFQTRKFVVRRGDNEVLRVGMEPMTRSTGRPPRRVVAGGPDLASDGVKPLFNGKDLSGWVHTGDKSLFTVEDGVILGKTDGTLARNEFLVTDRPYDDFILKAKVRLTSGNSGIQFRTRRAAGGTISGPQADMGTGYWGQLYEENGRGILGAYPDSKIARLVRQGDWNDFIITAHGGEVRVSLNGLVINELTDPLFDRSGFIALQLHKGPATEVRFKEIEIKELSPGGTTAGASDARIPPDAEPYFDKRFKVFKEELTWHQAKARCEALGGHLAIVTSKAENRFLMGLISAAGLGTAWLGATDEKVEGRWVWVDGSEMKFNSWVGIQPNNRSYKGLPEHYLMILLAEDGGWWDVPDQGEDRWHPGFVCQWDPGDDRASTAPAPDRLLAGTAWSGHRSYREGPYAGSNVTYYLHVRERVGNAFKGHVFDNGPNRNRSEVEGEVVGPSITWRETTGARLTIRGTLAGDEIRLTFVGDYGRGVSGRGDGELRLDGGAAGITGPTPPGTPGAAGATDLMNLGSDLLNGVQEEGWTSLFNGRDLTGWKLQPGGSAHWKVEGGVLVGRGPGMTQIFTERGDYTNFHAFVEACATDTGEAGFVFRSSYFDDGFVKGRGYIAQICCNPNNNALMGGMAGNLIAPGFRSRVKAGDWFMMDVFAIGNHITIKVNGVTSLDYVDRARAHSRGHLALRQVEGSEIRFRKVYVKELK